MVKKPFLLLNFADRRLVHWLRCLRQTEKKEKENVIIYFIQNKCFKTKDRLTPTYKEKGALRSICRSVES